MWFGVRVGGVGPIGRPRLNGTVKGHKYGVKGSGSLGESYDPFSPTNQQLCVGDGDRIPWYIRVLRSTPLLEVL